MINFDPIKDCPNCDGEGYTICMGGKVYRCNCEDHIEENEENEL